MCHYVLLANPPALTSVSPFLCLSGHSCGVCGCLVCSPGYPCALWFIRGPFPSTRPLRIVAHTHTHTSSTRSRYSLHSPTPRHSLTPSLLDAGAIREKHELEGSRCADFLTALFCPCCTIVQELAEQRDFEAMHFGGVDDPYGLAPGQVTMGTSPGGGGGGYAALSEPEAH